MPVTQNEIILEDSSMMVSRTDAKGQITFANEEFVEVSGFALDELIGSSHNIVRHPDMPPEAFADLWSTVKAGKPWTGIVKNRCKNGDYYWVEANVTPMMTDGQITGFISVRKKPSAKQVADALIEYGHMAHDSQWQKAVTHAKAFINSLSLKTKIVGSIVVAAAVTISISVMSLNSLSQSKQSVTTLYEDRVVPLKQIKLVADMYAVNIVDTSHKVRNGQISWQDGIHNVQQAQATIKKEWSAYTNTYLVEDEVKIVKTIEPLFKQADETTAHLLTILRTQDRKKIEEFTINELYQAIDPVSDELSKLMMVQLDVSEKINE